MDDEDNSPADSGVEQQVPGTLPFDAARYLEYTDEFDMTEAQKVEFLRTLWDIMSAFVDLGFGVDSVMTILCQKASENGADTLQEPIPKHEFNVAVDDETGEGAE